MKTRIPSTLHWNGSTRNTCWKKCVRQAVVNLSNFNSFIMSVTETVLDTKKIRVAKVAAPSENGTHLPAWKEYEKVLFRIAFIFFIAISIPYSVEWYKIVFNIDWTNLHYRDLYDIARFGSGINLFGNSLFGSTLLGYA